MISITTGRVISTLDGTTNSTTNCEFKPLAAPGSQPGSLPLPAPVFTPPPVIKPPLLAGTIEKPFGNTASDESGIKMAFTKEGVPTGTTSLYLELVEPDGPPGIIRAGGSGTIIVHCRAPNKPPQPNNFVLFKLK